MSGNVLSTHTHNLIAKKKIYKVDKINPDFKFLEN